MNPIVTLPHPQSIPQDCPCPDALGDAPPANDAELPLDDDSALKVVGRYSREYVVRLPERSGGNYGVCISVPPEPKRMRGFHSLAPAKVLARAVANVPVELRKRLFSLSATDLDIVTQALATFREMTVPNVDPWKKLMTSAKARRPTPTAGKQGMFRRSRPHVHDL